MNILFITSRLPYPPFRGDQAIPFYRLKILGGRHNVTLLTFYERAEELDYINKLSPYCQKIVVVKQNKVLVLWNLLSGILFSGLPFQVLYFISNKFKMKMAALLATDQFDIVHVYMLRMAEYAKDVDSPRILDLIDAMQLNLRKRILIEKFVPKLFFKQELKRIFTYENQMIEKYDASILVSDNDKNYFGLNKISAVPLGVDTDIYKRYSELPDNKTIIFSGNMGYYPNESAIIWFINNCFAAIRQAVPAVKLIIVGINPSPNIKSLSDKNPIFITGYVESMAAELNKAQIIISPMQSGYGMHIKLLEAMATAVPVVSTRMGLGAIKATHGLNILIAENPSDFTNNCITLLNDYELSKEIGSNARSLVLNNYSWDQHVNKIEEIYQKVSNLKNKIE